MKALSGFRLDLKRWILNNKLFYSYCVFMKEKDVKMFLKSLMFSVVILVFWAGSALAYLEIGTVAPDFQVNDLQGEKVSLSDYKGQVIVLKIGTTWCPDCVGQTDDLIAEGKFLKSNDAVVVDVFVQETEKTVSNYLKKKKFIMPFVPLLDNGQAHRAYQVYLIPRMVIIDRDFKVVHDGLRLSTKQLREIVAPLTLAANSTESVEKKSQEKP